MYNMPRQHAGSHSSWEAWLLLFSSWEVNPTLNYKQRKIIHEFKACSS